MAWNRNLGIELVEFIYHTFLPMLLELFVTSDIQHHICSKNAAAVSIPMESFGQHWRAWSMTVDIAHLK
jgi:hypothetical protein